MRLVEIQEVTSYPLFESTALALFPTQESYVLENLEEDIQPELFWLRYDPNRLDENLLSRLAKKVIDFVGNLIGEMVEQGKSLAQAVKAKAKEIKDAAIKSILDKAQAAFSKIAQRVKNNKVAQGVKDGLSEINKKYRSLVQRFRSAVNGMGSLGKKVLSAIDWIGNFTENNPAWTALAVAVLSFALPFLGMGTGAVMLVGTILGGAIAMMQGKSFTSVISGAAIGAAAGLIAAKVGGVVVGRLGGTAAATGAKKAAADVGTDVAMETQVVEIAENELDDLFAKVGVS